MSRYRFELAEPRDDAAVRSFLRHCVMPGQLDLTFQREPSYFSGGGNFGHFHQTMVCRDSKAEEIVGVGCRSVRQVHTDGQPGPMGYLSMLRSAERVRSGMLLARGYQFLRSLHNDGRANTYLTTIADGNERALSVLTSGRAGLPTYEPLGSYHTYAIATGPRSGNSSSAHDPAIDQAIGNPNLNQVLAFLGSHAKSRQFMPDYNESDFGTGDATFREMATDDVFGYQDGGHLRGVMALWDQRSFKQTVVHGYRGPLGPLRVAHNLIAPILGRPKLPPPGSQLNYGFVAIPAVENDDPVVFRALLGSVVRQARQKGLDYVLFGCHESDPLRKPAEAMSFLTYSTHVFLVSWNDEADPDSSSLQYDRSVPPYLELGCL